MRYKMAKCIECGGSPKAVMGDKIYPGRPDLHGKQFWLCQCGAYVGSHQRTGKPLGSPAGPVTRTARMKAHDVFDKIWRNKEMGRHKAYRWLAKQMGIAVAQCHIGFMTAQQALQVVEICKARLYTSEQTPPSSDEQSCR